MLAFCCALSWHGCTEQPGRECQCLGCHDPRDLLRDEARGAEKDLNEDPQGLGIYNCEQYWVKTLGQHRCWAAWVICSYSSYREFGSPWCEWLLWMFSSLFWKCYSPFHWNPGYSFCFMQYFDFGLGMGECMPLSLDRDSPSNAPHQDHGPWIFQGEWACFCHTRCSEWVVLLLLRDPASKGACASIWIKAGLLPWGNIMCTDALFSVWHGFNLQCHISASCFYLCRAVWWEQGSSMSWAPTALGLRR